MIYIKCNEFRHFYTKLQCVLKDKYVLYYEKFKLLILCKSITGGYLRARKLNSSNTVSYH